MRIISLGSGSKGNAYLVGSGGDWLLIDNGLAYRTFVARVKEAVGAPTLPICGVLVTHSHTDHTQGLATFLKHYDVPVYANVLTAEAVAASEKIDESAFCCFENGQEFFPGRFRVHPFSIPHDTSDPVGFVVRAFDRTYFHGTDIGTPLASVGLKLREADFATVESNHDLTLLKTSGRPPSLIQRIGGPRGHLSNDQACELVRKYASPKLERLALAHLSQDCNEPHLAEREMREVLAGKNLSAVTLKVFEQNAVVEL